MRKEQICDSLNLLDDAILVETDKIRNRKRRGRDWWKQAVAAAILVAVCGGTGVLLRYVTDSTGEDSFSGVSKLPGNIGIGEADGAGGAGVVDGAGAAGVVDGADGVGGAEWAAELPVLSIAEGGWEATGYEGYRVHEISELVNANPWNERMEISVLPVYENCLSYDENYVAQGADFDKMREFLTETAGRLGFDMDSLVITDDVPDEETQQIIIEKFQSVGDTVPEGYFNPTALVAEQDGVKVEVNQAMTATVSFEPAVALPEEYHFTHYASYEELGKVARYLEEEYGDFIGMEEPTLNIYGGDYNIYLQQLYGIEFYDACGSAVDQIINYNFNRTAFYCDDEGKLFLARRFQRDLSRKVGDYPIITEEEAKALLLNGNYVTSVPYEIPGEDYIGKVELVYRTGQWEKYYMPYYRFYVEVPEAAMDDGLKAYGAYYVPAVESAYIANMPVWDGSFN